MSSEMSETCKGPKSTAVLWRKDLQAEIQTSLGKEEKREGGEEGR